jgi:glycosyltransferase involved in cell wall biosynthesis
MKISFLVTCHNEDQELKRLLKQLLDHIVSHNCEDEIVVLDDYSTNIETQKIIDSSIPNIKFYQRRLDGDFSAHKNFGTSKCNNPWICQLDADEYLAEGLLWNLHDIIENNPEVELFRVPRINLVRGLTQEDAHKWGWQVGTLPQFPDIPIVNWQSGDHQSRIYKNDPRIHWHRKLHETVIGASMVCVIPVDPDYAIIHDKTIERQRQQNEFYAQNWSREANMGMG